MFLQKQKSNYFYSRPTNKILAGLLLIGFLAPAIFFVSIENVAAQEGADVAAYVPGGEEYHSGQEGGWVYNAVLRALTWICNGILWMFSYVVWMGAKVLDMSLDATRQAGFVRTEIVQTGWQVIRDLANMFFAIILLVIAFATILRLESYGMKRLLWKLVVAALLINFSLAIAGAIIDFSNVTTNYFLERAGVTAGQSDTSAIIFENMKIHEFYSIEGKNMNQTDRGDVGILKIFVNLIMGIIIMLTAAFTFAAAGVLFYIRMVALWIILIFSPLAWVGMIMPATEKLWHDWWRQFLTWVIFAPVYAFFIWLAIRILPATNNFAPEAQLGDISGELNLAQNTAASSFLFHLNDISQYVVIVIFLLAGLIFARRAGVIGASGVVNLGINMRKTAVGALAGGVAWTGGRALSRSALVVEKGGQGLAAAAQRLRKIPIVGRPAGWAAGKTAKGILATSGAGRQADRQKVETRKENYKNLTNENLRATLAGANAHQKAAILEILAERNKLEAKDREHFRAAASRGANTNTVLVAQPAWAKDIGESIDKYTEKISREGNLSKMNAETLRDPEVADSFRRMASSEQAFANSVSSLPNDLKEAIGDGLSQSIQSSKERDDFSNPENINRRTAYARATGDVNNAFKDSSGTVNESAAAEHIKNMSAQQVAQMKENDEASHALFARYMSEIQAYNIGKSGNVSPKIMVNIRNNIPEGPVREYVYSSDAWGAQKPQERTKETPPPHLAEYTKESKF